MVFAEYTEAFTTFTNPTDIDECESSPCDHNCRNTEGSYTCSCNPGYSLSRRTRCVGRLKPKVFLVVFISAGIIIEVKSIQYRLFS